MKKISVFQALVILVDKCEITDELSQLKVLLLEGAKDEQQLELILKYLKNPKIEKYKNLISKDFKVTDNDPVRRYFETVLTFETFRLQVKNINTEHLKNFFELLYQTIDLDQRDYTDDVFTERPLKSADVKFYGSGWIEFGEAYRRIKTNPHLSGFSGEEQEKLRLLIKICCLLPFLDKVFPLTDLYKNGYFESKNRGRAPKETQETVRNHSYGLMKSFMPAPYGDVVFSKDEFIILKPVDCSTYHEESKWVQKNAEYGVHPFSSSISGVNLLLMRALKWAENQKKLQFSDAQSLKNFLRCFISILLYNSGGHTIHEFIAVFSIPEIIENFKFIENFTSFTEENLFLSGNEPAFQHALQKTIEFNKTILKRYEVHMELQHKFSDHINPYQFLQENKRISGQILSKNKKPQVNVEKLEIVPPG